MSGNYGWSNESCYWQLKCLLDYMASTGSIYYEKYKQIFEEHYATGDYQSLHSSWLEHLHKSSPPDFAMDIVFGPRYILEYNPSPVYAVPTTHDVSPVAYHTDRHQQQPYRQQGYYRQERQHRQSARSDSRASSPSSSYGRTSSSSSSSYGRQDSRQLVEKNREIVDRLGRISPWMSKIFDASSVSKLPGIFDCYMKRYVSNNPGAKAIDLSSGPEIVKSFISDEDIMWRIAYINRRTTDDLTSEDIYRFWKSSLDLLDRNQYEKPRCFGILPSLPSKGNVGDVKSLSFALSSTLSTVLANEVKLFVKNHLCSLPPFIWTIHGCTLESVYRVVCDYVNNNNHGFSYFKKLLSFKEMNYDEVKEAVVDLLAVVALCPNPKQNLLWQKLCKYAVTFDNVIILGICFALAGYTPISVKVDNLDFKTLSKLDVPLMLSSSTWIAKAINDELLVVERDSHERRIPYRILYALDTENAGSWYPPSSQSICIRTDRHSSLSPSPPKSSSTSKGDEFCGWCDQIQNGFISLFKQTFDIPKLAPTLSEEMISFLTVLLEVFEHHHLHKTLPHSLRMRAEFDVGIFDMIPLSHPSLRIKDYFWFKAFFRQLPIEYPELFAFSGVSCRVLSIVPLQHFVVEGRISKLKISIVNAPSPDLDGIGKFDTTDDTSLPHHSCPSTLSDDSHRHYVEVSNTFINSNDMDVASNSSTTVDANDVTAQGYDAIMTSEVQVTQMMENEANNLGRATIEDVSSSFDQEHVAMNVLSTIASSIDTCTPLVQQESILRQSTTFLWSSDGQYQSADGSATHQSTELPSTVLSGSDHRLNVSIEDDNVDEHVVKKSKKRGRQSTNDDDSTLEQTTPMVPAKKRARRSRRSELDKLIASHFQN